jgi:hypothetical protein
MKKHKEYDKENWSEAKIHEGPFGLFNIDFYKPEHRGVDGKFQRPFKKFFHDQRGGGITKSDFDFIVGVVQYEDEEKFRIHRARVCDACWDRDHPEADLKKAMQFLLDLAEARYP